jgi:hypothetical protein
MIDIHHVGGKFRGGRNDDPFRHVGGKFRGGRNDDPFRHVGGKFRGGRNDDPDSTAVYARSGMNGTI